MQKWKKIVLAAGITGIILAGAVVAYVYLKPHRDVTREKGIRLTAQALYDALKANEKDPRYLNQAIELSGEILDVNTNQDGKTVVNFKTNDALVVINCTFKDNPAGIKAGDTITFKGICTGYIPDASVVINEGVLVK